MIRVLVVDDDPANLYLLHTLLEGHGYQVMTAGNGADALELARRDPPDLVVSDILMPVMDGFMLCRHWKADERLRRIPFAVYTATYCDPRDQALARTLGADAFIIKPADPDEFLREIHDVVKSARAGNLAAAQPSTGDERVVLREYNASLVRKLESKSLELEESNRRLRERAKELETHLAERQRAQEALARQAALLEERTREAEAARAASLDMLAKAQEEKRHARRAEERFRLVVESSPMPMLLVREDLAIVLVNARFEECFGYRRGEIIGRSVETLVPERHREAHRAEHARFFQRYHAGFVEAGRELRGLRKDGSEFPVEIGLALVGMPEGRMVLSTLMDLSERRQVEEQMREAQKMEAVGRLAAGIAHEFNNQLFVIEGFSDVLLNEPGSTRRMRQAAAEIHKAAERSAMLTRQLLAFGRKQVLHPTVVDLDDELSDLEVTIRPLLGERITLDVIRSKKMQLVKVDPQQLVEVVVNLALNARDAMPEGGRLSLETAEVELDAEFARTHPGVRAGPYVALRVTDTGTGMDPEARARAFEPFFSTKDVGKGTGMGLAAVRGIVEQSRGYVSADTRPGEGTCFTVYLPRLEPRKKAEVGKDLPQEYPQGAGVILVVEDEDSVRRLLCEVLVAQGYTVLSAARGDDAVALMEDRKSPIDLLVTDVTLPGLDGPEVLARLRSRWPGLKAICLSGYAQPGSTTGSLGPDVPLLAKPCSLGELISAVQAQI